MGIEFRNSDPTPPPAQPAKAAARSTPAQDDNTAPASPFMALLAALDTDLAPVAAELPQEVPVAQQPKDDDPLHTEAVPLMGLVQAWAAPAAETPVAAPPKPGVALEGATPGGSLQAKDAPLSAPPPAPMDTAEMAVSGAAGRKLRTAALMQEQAQDAQARTSDARAQDQRLQSERGARAEMQAVDGRAPAPAATQASAATTASTAEVFASLARGPQVQRGAERQAARGTLAEATPLVGGNGYDSLVQGNGAAMGPTTVSAMVPAGANATAALAEKLNFWMGRGVQTAELQLEALDGATVDVRIDLQGKDAKVEFRSDLPEARRWLQDAMPQLQDLMQDEGLRLSGGFVGTSAQGREDGSQPRQPGAGPARIGTVRMERADVVPRAGDAGRVAGQGMGRSVDLFV